MKGSRNTAGQGLGEQSFAHSRHIFQQEVPVREKRGKRKPNDIGLAAKNSSDVAL
jgi:hypothetical protein